MGKMMVFNIFFFSWKESSSNILKTCLYDEYALSRTLLLTHSLLKLLIAELVIASNNVLKGSKNSEYSVAFGGIARAFDGIAKTGFS